MTVRPPVPTMAPSNSSAEPLVTVRVLPCRLISPEPVTFLRTSVSSSWSVPGPSTTTVADFSTVPPVRVTVGVPLDPMFQVVPLAAAPVRFQVLAPSTSTFPIPDTLVALSAPVREAVLSSRKSVDPATPVRVPEMVDPV